MRPKNYSPTIDRPATPMNCRTAGNRDVKLDLLRLLAILECVVAHAMMGDITDRSEYLWIMIFFPDTAAVFFMASGALILNRHDRPCGWRYVLHRIMTYLPEFILFSVLYLFLNVHYGIMPENTTVGRSLIYMLVTPTWAPGWFILALTGLYFVTPFLASWVRTASRRQVEVAIVIWLVSTMLPVMVTQTYIDIPASTFGTVYNYAGYLLIGYYLVHWPLAQRSAVFKAVFFVATAGFGLVYGYFVGKSGLKWEYIDTLVTGLSFNIVMLSLLQFGVVLVMPDRWFRGTWARAVTRLSTVSLGIYCSHWLIIRYWAIPCGVDWVVSTAVTFAICIPVAFLMQRTGDYLRNKIKSLFVFNKSL